MKYRKINIGSGQKVMEGWDNLDQHDEFGANIIWDLNNLPLPIRDNTYDHVLCSHVLEDFANPKPLFDELVRICAKGGQIEIRVPYMMHVWDSVNHMRAFNILTFYDFLYHGDYGTPRLPLELTEAKFYYTHFSWWMWFFKNLFNFLLKLNRNAVDHTMIRYFGIGLSIKVIYKKNE